MTKAKRRWRAFALLRARAPETIALLACIFFAVVCFWEAFGAVNCGHFCSAAAVAIGGDNMLRLDAFAPVTNYFREAPPTSVYYVNHPYGVFLSSAATHAIFGHGPFAVRAPGAIYGMFTPPLIWAVTRAIWGRTPAAVATLSFVLMPINLAFAQFGNLEGVTIFWGLLFTWGTIRLWQTWRTRYQVAAVLGALGACHGDWIGFVLIGFVAAFAMLRGYFVPVRWFGRIDDRQHARWLALMVTTCVLTVCLYLYLTGKAHKLDDLLSAYDSRSAGASSPLAAILAPRRKMWLEWTLPVLASASLALALPLAAFQLLRGAALQIFILTWTAMATVQYVVFRQGADIHVFWPHYYGVPIAFACALLVREAQRVAAWVAVRLRSRTRRPVLFALRASALLFAVGYFGALGRMGLVQLRQSKLTGGQFDEGGYYISSGRDLSVFAEWAMQSLPEYYDLTLAWFTRAHNSEYITRRPTRDAHGLQRTDPEVPDRFALLDTRVAPTSELRAAAQQFSIVAAGPLWRVDRASSPTPIEALRFEQRQPRGLEWFLETGTDLVRSVGGPDPWATWEWRQLLDQDTGTSAPGEPQSLEQVRVAHNMAVSRRDAALAERLRERLLRTLDRRVDANVGHNLTLLGWILESGAIHVAHLYWHTGPQFAAWDGDFRVRSRVVAEPPLWWSAIDFYEKEVAAPGSAAIPLWKPGNLYVQRFVVMKRIGRERFEGFLASRDGGTARSYRIPLFTLD